MENNFEVKLLKRVKLDNEYFGFDFEKPEGYSFQEGQFAVFKFNDAEMEGRNSRIFSIASTNDEPVIRAATRIPENPSPFKQKLLDMEVGDTIQLSSPRGKFVLEPNEESVFIAGGIGITPIRSMILAKAKNHDLSHDELIYSELESCYPYRSEIEGLKGLHVEYAADIAPTQQCVKDSVNEFHNQAIYYISGSPGFVKGISSLLKENGVTEEHIRHDLFVGY